MFLWSTRICKQFQLKTCLECNFTVVLLANLESVSLDYLYYMHRKIYLNKEISWFSIYSCVFFSIYSTSQLTNKYILLAPFFTRGDFSWEGGDILPNNGFKPYLNPQEENHIGLQVKEVITDKKGLYNRKLKRLRHFVPQIPKLFLMRRRIKLL